MNPSEFEKTDSACPSCGYPAHAGHDPDCPKYLEVEEALTDSDTNEFFKLYQLVNEMPDEILGEKIKSFMEHGEEKHIFVVRGENRQIVGGAALQINQKGNRKEAYLRMKVVDEKYRGKGLASKLTQRRIQAAREAGCAEAWAMVGREDDPALRTIFKDGFAIREKGQSPYNFSYRVSLDLTASESGMVSAAEAASANMVGQEDDIIGDRLLIPWQNRKLIDKALSRGYVGRQLFFPKDLAELSGLQENLLYFEKLTKSKE